MSFLPRNAILGACLIAAPLALIACDDDGDPTGVAADLSLSAQTIDFGDVELNFGATGARTLTVMNSGGRPLNVSGYEITGPFQIASGGMAGTLAAGGSATVAIVFAPGDAGTASGTLEITSDDPDEPTVSVALSGNADSFQYTQVDRKGIPALNTVFNHPPAFSKTDYNTAGPDMDLATYRGQFETVLGAVGNEDPEGTAGLLLPDELPVSLGAATTAFATLTGRALADDAVDVALFVTVGIEELQSDNVDANDVAFLGEFPYLAPAN
jgi:hypothetical protein